MVDAHQAIKAAARRTGLSPHVIRIWEKRYGAVRPERTPTNRRLYTEAQIERLTLLKGLTEQGHSIGQVAQLPVERLRELAAEGSSPGAGRAEDPVSSPFLEECLAAVKALDARSLEGALKRGAVALGGQGLLQAVIAPLVQAIGDLWRQGALTAAHEHFASAVIRIFLGHAAQPFVGSESAPGVVVATPVGQLHELGALLAGAAAAHLGWKVTYLGASLPAAEIAGAARQSQARAVALSLVYPEDDPRLEGELRRLRESLPAHVALVVGGRAAPAYRAALAAVNAHAVEDLAQLGEVLDTLRQGRAATT